jgi:hypothetical protein
MPIDTALADDFVIANARVLERHRHALLLADGAPEPVETALAGYANADGGFGWTLHPDLRSRSSQPVAAIHAFEVLEEIAPRASALAGPLCDWLDQASLADGGLPFALPCDDWAGSAPMWAASDHTQSSLLITAAVCGAAHRVAPTDPVVAGHPWLERAAAYCQQAIAAMDEPAMAIELKFALQLLDAVHDTRPGAEQQLDRLVAFLPASGTMAVAGGAEGERMRPLDFSPDPGTPRRDAFSADVIAADLDELEAEMSDDGGWDVDFQVYSPAAVVEWRGYETVRALKTLRANGR